LGAFAFGQTANAVLTGTTVDSSGALIPGVEVKATNVETGVTTTGVSNETGAYRIGSLLPGVYTVRGELPGFRVQTFTDVRLGSGVTVRMNFNLQVGGQTETVEVTASAATLLLESSPSVGGDGNVIPFLLLGNFRMLEEPFRGAHQNLAASLLN